VGLSERRERTLTGASKVDELIHAMKRAHNELIEAEDLTEDQLDELHDRYSELAKRYHGELNRRRAGRQQG
jgi:low affinity Fe/Cu permease